MPQNLQVKRPVFAWPQRGHRVRRVFSGACENPLILAFICNMNRLSGAGKLVRTRDLLGQCNRPSRRRVLAEGQVLMSLAGLAEAEQVGDDRAVGRAAVVMVAIACG